VETNFHGLYNAKVIPTGGLGLEFGVWGCESTNTNGVEVLLTPNPNTKLQTLNPSVADILIVFRKLIIMNREDKDREQRQNESASPKPDPETLHTTDPQENMEGPISSLMHNTGEAFETDETKRDAEEKKEDKM